MKISGKEAYSVMLSDSPDIMNIEEMCSVGRTYRVPKVHVLSYLKIVDENPAK